VLQVYPSAEYLARLPDGRLPCRDDFLHFIDAPDQRIDRWRLAVSASEALGEQLMTDITENRIPELVQPM
jgi:hypothetical protein